MTLLRFRGHRASTSRVYRRVSGLRNVGCRRDRETRCRGEKAIQRRYSTTNRSTHVDARQTLDGDFPSSTDGKNLVVGRECDGMYVFGVSESEKELIVRRHAPESDGTFCRKCDEMLVVW